MNNIKDYKRLEFELHEYLVQLKDMLLLLNSSQDYMNKISEDIEQLKTKRFLVAVIGEFKRGKSSLINALLGADILPSDVTPTTATINRIIYGSQATAVLYYKDGTTFDTEIDKLSDYVTKLSEGANEQSGRIKEAIITYPVEICRNNIEIIDTPGLNDDERMTAVTLDMVSNIDAAIVTISAISPVSKTEQALIAQLIRRENIGTIVFVVTFVDQIDEEDRERLFENIKQRISVETLKLLQDEEEEVLLKAHRILDEVKLYGVSSKLALKAFAMNKQSLMKDSGFDVFRNALYQTLISEQGMLAVHKSIQSIYSVVGELEKQYNYIQTEVRLSIEASEELMRVVQKYKDNYVRPLDQGFATEDAELTELVKIFQGAEKKLLQLFIAELSSLRSNTNQEVKAAIVRAAAFGQLYMKGEEMERIRKEIAGRLAVVVGSYQNQLSELFEKVKVHQIDVQKTKEQLFLYQLKRENIFEPIRIPEFILALTPISKNSNLVDYNIISDIKADINRSVTAYMNNWGLFIRQFRMWCFSKAEFETKVLFDYIKQQLAESVRNNQKRLHINDANYDTIKMVSSEIINKVKQI